MFIAILVLMAGAFAIEPAAALDRESTAKALRSTVQVIVPDNDFEYFSLGSGTILTDGGLILTNHHVVEGDRPNGLMNDDGLVGIAVTPPDLRGESILKYFGVVVKVNEELDLALVEIRALADDPDADLPDNLGLAPIELGNSDDMMISDEINMFGYPGLGGNTPTYTKGIVAGFLDENRDGVYEWIKTDAELGHGNSGGLATDGNGRFVGVPTAGNVEDASQIGLVRTGNLAVDFFRSYFPRNNTSGGPSVGSVRYAEAINRRGEPLNPAVRFASGITDLYGVFDYSGLEDDKTLTYIWYIDGFESLRDSFAWDGGASGTSWVSVYNDEGLPDGFIELELIYDGQTLYRGGIVVGSGEAPGDNRVISLGDEASFGPITFAEDVVNDQPVNTGATFSVLNEIYGFFEYSAMANGTAWKTRWYYNDQMVLEDAAVWDAGSEGSYWVSLYHPDGLPAGQYSLELYIDDEVAQTGDFAIAESAEPTVRDINVIGVVLDQDNTRISISGALVVFLNPGVTIDDWIDSDFADDMVYATGTSNRSGEFQLDARVTPGEYYSVVVVHDDYQAVAVDDYQIPPEATDPYELEVTMELK